MALLEVAAVAIGFGVLVAGLRAHELGRTAPDAPLGLLAYELGFRTDGGNWQGLVGGRPAHLYRTVEGRVALRLDAPVLGWHLEARPATEPTGDEAFDEHFSVDWDETPPQLLPASVRDTLRRARGEAYLVTEQGFIELVWAKDPDADGVQRGAAALAAVVDALTERSGEPLAADPAEPGPLRARAALAHGSSHALPPLLASGAVPNTLLDQALETLIDADAQRAVALILAQERSARWQWAARASVDRHHPGLAAAWRDWWPRAERADHHAVATVVAPLLLRWPMEGDVGVMADCVASGELSRTLRRSVLDAIDERATADHAEHLREAATHADASVAERLRAAATRGLRASGVTDGRLSMVDPASNAGGISLADDAGGGLSEA